MKSEIAKVPKSIGERVKPLPGLVLIKALKVEQLGSIYIPEDQQQSAFQSTVIAVGEDTDKVKIAVKPGDVVFHTRLPGTLVVLEDEEYIFAKHDNILAIVEED